MDNTLPMDISMKFLNNKDFCIHRPEILQEIMALKNMRRVALGPDMTVIFENPQLIWWQIQEILRVEQGDQAQLQEEWDVYSPLIPTKDSITLTLMIEIQDPIARKKALRSRMGIERCLFLEGSGFRIQSEPIDIGNAQGPVTPLGPEDVQNFQKDLNASHKKDPQNQSSLGGDLRKNGSNGAIHDGSSWDSGGGPTEAEYGKEVGAQRDDHKTDKTSSVHFLRFPLTQSTRNAFAMGEPVLSCQHPQALYRTPIVTLLWNALCQDLAIVPLKY
jgi:hypothetical protein